MATFKAPTVLEPVESHQWTIVLLHGRGSNAEYFRDDLLGGRSSDGKLLNEMFPGTRWIFPCAHSRYSTVFREKINEWFDIKSLSDPDSGFELQLEGLRESVEHVHEILRQEQRIIAADRIILGGISQGFAVAAHAFLSQPKRLAGFVGLSGWIPKAISLNSLDEVRRLHSDTIGIHSAGTPETIKTPVYTSHTNGDSVVELEHGKTAADTLQRIGLSAKFEIFESEQHWVAEPLGYDGLASFLRSIMQSETDTSG